MLAPAMMVLPSTTVACEPMAFRSMSATAEA